MSLLLAGVASTLVDDGKSLFLWGDDLEYFCRLVLGNNITCSKRFASMVIILESTKFIFKILSNLFNSLQAECVFPSSQ